MFSLFWFVFKNFFRKMTIHLCKSLILNAVKDRRCIPHGSCSLFVLFFSTSELKPISGKNLIFDVLRKYGISSEIASNVASELPDSRNLAKCDSVLSFLNESGFSKFHLEKLLNLNPRVLLSSVEITIKPKIKVFQGLGFSNADVAKVPWVLSYSVDNRVIPSVTVLKDVLGSTSEVAEFIKKPACCTYLKHDLKKTLLPNMEILRSCGVSRDRIIKDMSNFPRYLLNKPERIMEVVETVDKLGCDRNSMTYLYAVRTIASMSRRNWELKWDLFRKLGILEEKILWMFQKKPQAFAVSIRKIKEVVKVLLDTKKYDMEYICNEPDVLMSSVEKRLKPRLRALEVLECRNLLQQRPRLSTVYKTSDALFCEWFVLPYLEEVADLKLLYENVWANTIAKSDNPVKMLKI